MGGGQTKGERGLESREWKRSRWPRRVESPAVKPGARQREAILNFRCSQLPLQLEGRRVKRCKAEGWGAVQVCPQEPSLSPRRNLASPTQSYAKSFSSVSRIMK